MRFRALNQGWRESTQIPLILKRKELIYGPVLLLTRTVNEITSAPQLAQEKREPATYILESGRENFYYIIFWQ